MPNSSFEVYAPTFFEKLTESHAVMMQVGSNGTAILSVSAYLIKLVSSTMLITCPCLYCVYCLNVAGQQKPEA